MPPWRLAAMAMRSPTTSHQRNATPARQEAHEALKADGNEVRVIGEYEEAEEVGLVRAERIAPLEPLAFLFI